MSSFNSYLQIFYSANARTSPGGMYKFESVQVRFGEGVNGLVDEV